MSESETLPEGDPLKPLTEYRFACKIEGCANFGFSIGEHHELYGKYGYYKKPENRIYRCKACLRHILVSHKVPIRRTVEAPAAEVLGKEPVRRPRKAQVLPQCAPFVRAMQDAAALQLRDDPVDEVFETRRQVGEHHGEAVAGSAGLLFGSAG